LRLIYPKCVLFTSILIFALGSLLCGAAQVCDFLKITRPLVVMFSQDLNWLISARALSGVGGGGIVNSVWVITSELVEIPNRAKWSQALSVTWSCSAVAGPLLGGAFSSTPCSPYPAYPISSNLSARSSSTLSWRWACTL
jgi:MFS family permease